jgi:uncharacterized protein
VGVWQAIRGSLIRGSASGDNQSYFGTASRILLSNLHRNTYNEAMKFRWDEKKRRANILNHGFDFLDAKEVFEGITFTLEDDRFDSGEERFITLGLLEGSIVVVAHTEKGNEVRVISMRKATRHEQKIYFE